MLASVSSSSSGLNGVNFTQLISNITDNDSAISAIGCHANNQQPPKFLNPNPTLSVPESSLKWCNQLLIFIEVAKFQPAH